MSHAITRQAALIEIEGEVMVLNLSADGWKKVLAIAAAESGGQLTMAPCPNQMIFDVLSTPSGTPPNSTENLLALAERVKKQDSEALSAGRRRMDQIRGSRASEN